MPKTARGIYHNLKESKYTISNGEVVFFFSSRFYMRKFLNVYQENRIFFKNRISKILIPTQMNLDRLADLQCYRAIEKRGFRAWLRGDEISCEDLFMYFLRKNQTTGAKEWKVVQKPPLGSRVKHMR